MLLKVPQCTGEFSLQLHLPIQTHPAPNVESAKIETSLVERVELARELAIIKQGIHRSYKCYHAFRRHTSPQAGFSEEVGSSW